MPLPSGTFTIGKQFDFEAGHRLPSLPPEHKCSRQHGHSYQVEVILTAPALEDPGFVTDFGSPEQPLTSRTRTPPCSAL
ncbi:6-pyruvoyl trahydropterin synthase family protein [Streptomyces sp. NPDC052236]|uniref:6-pyruvoyl trahydropterin synthase family protein n=1 Tax=Streptomyces sp. NPDC052236 TaxID=3365686 RepID=UPI0037D03377